MGLYEITHDPADRWKYRTSSLRNVVLTSPYVHNGALQGLAAVINFYDLYGIANRKQPPLIRPLWLTLAEKQKMLSFLQTLNSADVDKLVDDVMNASTRDHQVACSAKISASQR